MPPADSLPKNNRLSLQQWVLIVALFVVYGVVYLNAGERIPINRGFGHDGNIYGNLVLNFDHEITRIDDYRLQRIFPILIVRAMLALFDVPLTHASVIRAFAVYNFLLLLTALCLWRLTARALNLRRAGEILGLTGLFINFAVLKFYFYYPVLTDMTAYVIALGMAYAFVERRHWLLLALTVAGAWTWPTLLITGLVLYVWPRQERSGRPLPGGIDILLLSTLMFVLSGAILYVNVVRHHEDPTGMWTYKPLLPLSAAALLVYAFLAFKELINGRSLWPIDLQRDHFLRLMVAVLLWGGIQVIVASLHPSHSPLFAQSLFNLVHLGLRVPFIFAVSHIVYYGAAVMFLFLFWKDFCAVIHRYGYGLAMVIFIGLIFSFSAESRHTAALAAFFLVFLAEALDRYAWSRRQLGIVVAVALLYSKIWFVINTGFYALYNRENALKFPLQRYYMHQGNFMNYEVYLVQGAVICLTFVGFYFLKRSLLKRTGEDQIRGS